LITNTALKLKARNHSKRFTNLYAATINGVKITTPGVDATVFAGSTDLVITNTSDHPVIIVLNYNGNYGGIEEVMSL
jgi:vancomycin resistance protein YoaR